MKRRKKKPLVQLVLPTKSAEPESTGSEVARIKAQITAEQESAQRALSSFAYGSAQHKFITRRMENIGKLHEELKKLVPEDEAAEVLFDALEKIEEGEGP